MYEISIDGPTDRMRRAWQQKMDSYLPIFQGRRLREEDGDPSTSLDNLRTLLETLKVRRCLARPRGPVLIEFLSGEEFLATGFSMGEESPKVAAFAEFAKQAGFGKNAELLYRYLLALRDPDLDEEVAWPSNM